MTSYIMQHLEINNILYDLQHGFRQNWSCKTHLLSFIHELMFKYDKDIQSDIILIHTLCQSFLQSSPQMLTLQAALVWYPRKHLLLNSVIFK